MSSLACPFCGSEALSLDDGAAGSTTVECEECMASGPFAKTNGEAIRRWNRRVAIGEPSIRLEEEPNETGGLRMTLYYGAALCVLVTHVPEPFAATMRGALMLIGGMAKSADLEDA